MSTRSRAALIFFGLIICAGLLLQTPLLHVAREGVWSHWTSIVGTLANVGSLSVSNDVAEQLATLTAENARLKAELSDYARLRRQIGSPARDDFRTITGTVTGRPVESLRSELFINRGADDGVVVGAPVVVQGSVLVGFITNLHDEFAVVRLLVHPQTRIAAEVMTEKPARALVQGRAYTTAYLVDVPKDVTLSPGQNVLSVAESSLLPYGLIIGTVETVETEEHDPYQYARLALPYDPDRLVAITVLAPP